ncbi:LOW QUALITY PROTEIN: hypothetical protein Cgig2_001514 [Carnegiea gigantea]|uniref:Cytochrome P450 n=1 Tax=Carnegiea gigantea TaxID=171969 RepID=A0A9Q1KUM2_9CARY|nr:LOW QUALITY PROTEIN: hypothetical protein Cgig2_001514 [Carnegiea gigantea]
MDMEITYCSVAFLASIFFLYKLLFSSASKHGKTLPPSPSSIPILGHLHLLKPPFHRTLHALAQRHGPVFYLRLGYQPAVVVSAPWAAEECFTRNDVAFANRPNFLMGHHLGYNNSILLWAPYGPHWRNLRRVATVTTLSQKQIDLMSPARRVEVRSMIRELFRSSQSGPRNVINLNEVFAKLARNLVMRQVNGRPWERTLLTTPTSSQMSECDFFPVLRWVGYKGIEKELLKLKKQRDGVLQSLVDEYRERRAIHRTGGVHGDDAEKRTMMDELFELQEAEPDYYTDETLKGLILVMLIAGSETSAQTLEWAMALLLKHPDILEKAKIEINTHIDKERLVEDSDLSKLTYISWIINETLRLFPPAPLLVPHYSSQDSTIGGYHVPKGTMLFVNAWAIHRDPTLWEEPTEFKPERFEKEKLEGLGFKFFPFGMGRRACPGSQFALRNMTLVLATLLQCFDWEATEPVDLKEDAGAISMPKEKPLHAICHPRPSMEGILSQIIWCTLAFLAAVVFLHNVLCLFKPKREKKLPPSPPSLPILGHVYIGLLKPPLHRILRSFSQRYGPIFSLQLGCQPAVPMGRRPVPHPKRRYLCQSAQVPHGPALGLQPLPPNLGPLRALLRNLRRAATLTTFSRKSNWEGVIRHMFRDIFWSCESGIRNVNLNEAFAKLARNLEMRPVIGTPWESTIISMPSNLMTACDFVPVLKWFGYQGIEKKMIKAEKRDGFGTTTNSRAFRRTGDVLEKKPMIDELLDLQEAEPDSYTDDTLKGLILVMLLAGSDTSAPTLEWAMALLLNHPEVLKKAKIETDTHIDKGCLVEDSDVSKLTNINCIINETLRLFPPAPVLIPHYSSQDCTIGEYCIPKGTMLLVNAWAIHRDPAVWGSLPSSSQSDSRKKTWKDLALTCPGTNFALRNVTLVSATLLQCFDWEAAEPVDLNERAGSIIMPKEKPWHALCQLRPSMKGILALSTVKQCI